MNLKIIDVNLNRATESLRILEDISRFYFQDASLTLKLKKFRQRAFQGLRHYNLLFYRDIAKDPGKFLNPEKEFQRKDLSEIITANCRRLQESTRVLEEFLKISEPALSRKFKALRFFGYDLEKRLVSGIKKSFDLTLYAILDASLVRPADMVKTARALLDGGATMLQFRAKDLSTSLFYRTGLLLKNMLRKKKVPFIINDRIDMAVALDADGVHVGPEDLPPPLIRSRFGFSGIIGYSATREQEIRDGLRFQVDYIGLGPVFATDTKPDAKNPLGLERTRILYRQYSPKVPMVVIGGINEENISECLRIGIRHFALISALLKTQAVKSTTRKFKTLIKGAHP